MLFKLYTCVYIPTICKYLINGLLTNLPELLKCQYFTTCFHACNTVPCRHNLMINCEILVWRLQSFPIVFNKIKITFIASNCYFELYKLYTYTNRHFLNLDNTKAAYFNKSVFEFYLFLKKHFRSAHKNHESTRAKFYLLAGLDMQSHLIRNRVSYVFAPLTTPS